MQAGAREIGTLVVYCGRAGGHAVSGRKKKGLARVLQSQTHHTRERKKDEEGKEGKDEEGNSTTVLVLLTNAVIVRSVPLLCLLQRPPRVAVVAAFESCLLTMRTERGVGLHWQPSEKGTDFCC